MSALKIQQCALKLECPIQAIQARPQPGVTCAPAVHPFKALLAARPTAPAKPLTNPSAAASIFDSTLSAGQAIWRRICEAVLAQIQVELAALKELNRLIDQWVGPLLQPAKFKLRHKIQFQFRTFHCPVHR
jgi:hypothetical protein